MITKPEQYCPHDPDKGGACYDCYAFSRARASSLEKRVKELEAERYPKAQDGHSETMSWEEWAHYFRSERDRLRALLILAYGSLLYNDYSRWLKDQIGPVTEADVAWAKERLR